MKASEVRAKCPNWVHGAGKPGGKFCEHLSPDEVWCRLDDIHCHVMPSLLRERQTKAEAERINKTQTSLLDAANRLAPAQPAARTTAPPTMPDDAPRRAAPTAPTDRPQIPEEEQLPNAKTSPDPKVVENVDRLIDETQRIAAYLSETTWSFTRVDAGLSCMRKYWLKYIVHAEIGGTNRMLELGSAFHEAIDAIDSHSEVTDTSEMEPEDRAKLIHALMAFSESTARDQFGECNREIKGSMKFAGYPINFLLFIDRTSRDGKTLFNIEYGTEGINDSPLQSMRQVALSLYLAPEAERVTLINVRMAKQKMKKGESESDFGLRLKNETKEPLITYERKDVNVVGEMAEIGMAALHIAMGVIAGYSTGVTHSNRTINCGNCEYNVLCEQWVKCWGNPSTCAEHLKAKCRVADACQENVNHRSFIGLK